MRRAFGLAVALAACGGANEEPAKGPVTVSETCRIQIAPREAPLAPLAPGASAAVPPTRLVTHVEMPFALLASELDREIPVRVAEERGKSIGMAGSLDYEVDRAPFSVTTAGDALVIATDLKARAHARAKGRTYASCEPIARAVATVPLRLNAGYHFQPSKVTVRFVRGCNVKLGFVRIDVTPMIEAQLEGVVRKVERTIDARLPPVRGQAERMWSEMTKPRALPLGACAVLLPERIEQGPIERKADALRMRFAVVASPELRGRCGDPPSRAALPPLTQYPTMPAEDALELALVLPPTAIASAAEGANAFALDTKGGARAQPRTASADAAAGALRLDLGMRGEACGDVATRLDLAWTSTGDALVPQAPTVDAADLARLAKVGLDGGAFGRGLAASLKVAPPIAPEALRTMLPELASSMSDERMEVIATVTDTKPAAVTLREDGVAARVKIRGSLTLRAR